MTTPALSHEVASPLAELVARAKSGDKGAEALLCERFVPAIRAFARRRLRGSDAVNEFTQDVLILLIEALRTGVIRQPEAIAGYVLGVCRNVTQGRARQERRREGLWAQYIGDLQPLELSVEATTPLPVAKLEDCLSQLSRRSRDILRLSFFEMKSHAEIATEMDLSPANARVLRHRSLASLRDCMGQDISWERT